MNNLPLQGPLPGLTQVWVRYSKGTPKMLSFDIYVIFPLDGKVDQVRILDSSLILSYGHTRFVELPFRCLDYQARATDQTALLELN